MPPRAQTRAGQLLSGSQEKEEEKPWSKRLNAGLLILVLILSKSDYFSKPQCYISEISEIRESVWTLLPPGLT